MKHIFIFMLTTWIIGCHSSDYHVALAKDAHDCNPPLFAVNRSDVHHVQKIITHHKNSSYTNPCVIYLLQRKSNDIGDSAHWADTSEKCLASGALSINDAKKIARYVPGISAVLKQLE
jgi:hypothetical protein